MKNMKIKDITVPIKNYPTVQEDGALYDVALALEKSQQGFKLNRYRHRAVLVLDKKGDVVGKMTEVDLVVGLEDGYRKIGDLRGVTHTGFTPEFIKMMISQHSLWQRPLDDICRKAARVKVKDLMYVPPEGEYIDLEAGLDQAIHQFVMGHYYSLLVTEKGRVVGVLRFSDLVAMICEEMKACGAPQKSGNQ